MKFNTAFITDMTMTNMKTLLQRRSAVAFGAVLIASMAMIGCKQNNDAEPQGSQAFDSQAAADLTAQGLGTNSGGDGLLFDDAMSIAHGHGVPQSADEVDTHTPGVRDSSFDPVSYLHTVTVTRMRTRGDFSFNGTFVHTWTYYDATGAAMPAFVKGVTDKVALTIHAVRTGTTPRAISADSTIGSWNITNLIAAPERPLMNGTFNRAGNATLHTKWNSNRTMTHTVTTNFVADTLVKDTVTGYTYLLGNANSNLTAVSGNGQSFTRVTQIIFHGDGTATLNVTRTSGTGVTDTFTIDVRDGKWLRDDHIG